jgi:uncharacterized membrane protein YfcA
VIVAAVLSAAMGIVLGLLGGGGSILTEPILVYVLGVDAHAAIPTSLLVVGATSVACLVPHARARQVRWKTGVLFGATAMLGAWGGGMVAGTLPRSALLLAFAALMVATAIAMLRSSSGEVGEIATRPGRAKLAALALVVGGATGLVGAGGGFLVVPALALLVGLPMRAAVGTSLLVVALNSFAGLAGHLGHARVDLELAAVMTVAAIGGALAGAALSRRVDPARLRRVFGWTVLAVAGYALYRETPAAVRDLVLVERWPFWAGGIGIGVLVVAFLLVARKPLGVSTGYEDACAATVDPAARRSWRLPFLGGIVAGGMAAAVLAGSTPTLAMGSFDTAVTASLLPKLALFAAGGVLIGFGTRLAGGCTSGHGIVGVAQLARSSLLATLSFMAAGLAVSQLLFRVLGG